jgi:uncharacterized protein (TIGR00106 family)
MAIMEISVVPLGEGCSVSKYVAKCVEVIQRYNLTYEITAMGTIIEGDLEKLMEVALLMHKIPFDMGAKRVLTTIKIDDRRDKTSTIYSKVESVKNKISK